MFVYSVVSSLLRLIQANRCRSRNFSQLQVTTLTSQKKICLKHSAGFRIVFKKIESRLHSRDQVVVVSMDDTEAKLSRQNIDSVIPSASLKAIQVNFCEIGVLDNETGSTINNRVEQKVDNKPSAHQNTRPKRVKNNCLPNFHGSLEEDIRDL